MKIPNFIDNLVSISHSIPVTVSNPILFGALRDFNDSDSFSRTWVSEARAAIVQGNRVILVGDITDHLGISQCVESLIAEFPNAMFGLLLHWTQAAEILFSSKIIRNFNSIFVIVDAEIEKETVATISHLRPQWIVMPSSAWPWTQWVANTLFPKKFGQITLLAPSHEYADLPHTVLSPDEIRIQIEDFQFQHPLIEINPAPSEWFTPGELGPWLISQRDPSRSQLIFDSRQKKTFHISVIVPYYWNGQSTSLDRLNVCLNSIFQCFSDALLREVILVVDESNTCRKFSTTDLTGQNSEQPNLAVISVRRTTADPDWRAGFVRNIGAKYSASLKNDDGFFIFIDSDIEIIEKQELQRLVAASKCDILQLANSEAELGFEFATSRLVVVRRSFFSQINGFADAFCSFGCEDNFLIWKARKAGGSIGAISKKVVSHLRPINANDKLNEKMFRLRESANLMYRMTLDPQVHNHFFVCFGRATLFRAVLKNICAERTLRFAISPLLFLLTLIEIDDRSNYLRSLYETITWKVRLPRFQLVLLKRMWRIIQSNLWFFSEPTAWIEMRVPLFYRFVWRPLLKIRYFFNYHLIQRWRKS